MGQWNENSLTPHTHTHTHAHTGIKWKVRSEIHWSLSNKLMRYPRAWTVKWGDSTPRDWMKSSLWNSLKFIDNNKRHQPKCYYYNCVLRVGIEICLFFFYFPKRANRTPRRTKVFVFRPTKRTSVAQGLFKVRPATGPVSRHARRLQKCLRPRRHSPKKRGTSSARR